MELPLAPAVPPLHVIVDFGGGVPAEARQLALFEMEYLLRVKCGIPALVFQHEAADDLKRRRDMTDEDRKRL